MDDKEKKRRAEIVAIYFLETLSILIKNNEGNPIRSALYITHAKFANYE